MNRTLPHDIIAEQAVIGSMIIENTTVDDILGHIAADDFYHTGNQNIFRSILALIEAGRVADLVTVCDHMETSGTLNKSGGRAYVSEVVDAVVSPSSIKSYAQVVKNKSTERRIISEASKIIEAAYSPADDAKTILEDAQKSILRLSLDRNGKSLRTVREIARSAFDEIEKRHSNGGENIIGITTGLRDLDSIVLGLNQGDLIIVAARPGMGKTSLAMNIAVKAALDGVPSLVFSLEMPANSLFHRILAGSTGMDSRLIRRGMIFSDQWPKLVNATGNIASTPLFIDDQPDITVQEIRAKCRKLKQDSGLGLVVVDYIQLMRVTGKHDNREQQVAEISRTLKLIAREMECPVIGLSQLNRQVDSRSDRRPMMSDLRESGAIEQDADMIFFIYRDEVYNKSEDNVNRGIAEIDIAKNRNGATGKIKTVFNAKTQTFRDLDHHT